jgi:hypothetical protein
MQCERRRKQTMETNLKQGEKKNTTRKERDREG